MMAAITAAMLGDIITAELAYLIEPEGIELAHYLKNGPEEEN